MSRPRISRISRFSRTTAAAAIAGAAVVSAGTASAAPAAAATTPTASPSPLGTAKATAGEVDLDLQLLGGLLGALHPGGSGLDVPLANLVLGHVAAPTAQGDAANFTNSTLRLRDDLINQLHLPGPEANLLDADAVSGTARVTEGPGGYAQAYATVTNLRLFLPLVTLPGADAANGILKIDVVSAQATCAQGQKPVASAKLPTTVQLLGRQIPVPLSGDIPLHLGVADVDVHLSPTTVQDASGASAAIEARISINAVGLAKVSGAIILASAACTSPRAAGSAASGGGNQGSRPAGTTGTSGGTKTGARAGTATIATGAQPAPAAATAGTGPLAAGNAADGGTPLANTGTPVIIWPIAGGAVAVVLAGAFLMRGAKRARGRAER